MRTRLLIAAFFILASSPALADVPAIADSAVAPACEAAKALDACPDCACEMRTSTHGVDVDERTSDIVLGVVLHLEGPRNGEHHVAIHVALGTSTKLVHAGRLATGEQGTTITQFDVTALAKEMTMCPGACDFESVGLVHPFELTTWARTMADDFSREHIVEKKSVVLCFEHNNQPQCSAVAVALEDQLTIPQVEPGMKLKVVSKAGWSRKWSFGKRADLKLGAATGKLGKAIPFPKALTIPLAELALHPEATALTK